MYGQCAKPGQQKVRGSTHLDSVLLILESTGVENMRRQDIVFDSYL
jgi:hypothetical protein